MNLLVKIDGIYQVDGLHIISMLSAPYEGIQSLTVNLEKVTILRVPY